MSHSEGKKEELEQAKTSPKVKITMHPLRETRPSHIDTQKFNHKTIHPKHTFNFLLVSFYFFSFSCLPDERDAKLNHHLDIFHRDDSIPVSVFPKLEIIFFLNIRPSPKVFPSSPFPLFPLSFPSKNEKKGKKEKTNQMIKLF